MKTIFKLMLLLVMVTAFLLPVFASADEDPPWPVAGKTATADYEGVTYRMDFFQGPFGPRDNGRTDIYVGGVFWKSLPYREGPLWMVTVDGFANFKYTYGELTWIQGPLIVFKVDEPDQPG